MNAATHDAIKIELVIRAGKLEVRLPDQVREALDQTPPLDVKAMVETHFALVGDTSDGTYHVYTYGQSISGGAVHDLGSTGDRFDPANPRQPGRVKLVLEIRGAELRPAIPGAEPHHIDLARFTDIKRALAFGAASSSAYWLACNLNDRFFHLYCSYDGLGGWMDLGRWIDPGSGRPISC